MKTVIKAYFSEMDGELDGIFVVDVPLTHQDNYKEFISSVGNLLDESQNFDDAEDLIEYWKEENSDNEIITVDFVRNYAEEIIEAATTEGSHFSRTMDFITNIEDGWSYNEVVIDETYDSDYCKFD